MGRLGYRSRTAIQTSRFAGCMRTVGRLRAARNSPRPSVPFPRRPFPLRLPSVVHRLGVSERTGIRADDRRVGLRATTGVGRCGAPAATAADEGERGERGHASRREEKRPHAPKHRTSPAICREDPPVARGQPRRSLSPQPSSTTARRGSTSAAWRTVESTTPLVAMPARTSAPRIEWS